MLLTESAVIFENVSKKFQRGERHDSLRDLVPAIARGLFRRRAAEELQEQEFWALRDVSFQVARGEALGIVGPNGAGKSTTLKLLTKILRPTVGRSAVKGRIGALIEVAAGFHPDLTGRENIFLQGAIMGMRRAEIATKMDEIIEFAGVSKFVDTPVKRYSSGMNARLGFAIAAHLEPDVLIIDEVLSVGDIGFQHKCVERMREYKRTGVTIVFVSHNLQAVLDLCDRAMYIAGTVRALGPAAEVIGEYVRADYSTLAAESDHLNVLSADLVDAQGLPVRQIASGSLLTLRVRYAAERPVIDAEFGIAVCRSTDGQEIYHANVGLETLGAPDTGLDGTFVVELSFRAHLVRGPFFVGVHVFHVPTHTYLSRLAPAAHFDVVEALSRAGIANLDLTARLVEN
jgi:lipopolysaccharide transport system ATP-binding protein